jgi:putative serine protease PepD
MPPSLKLLALTVLLGLVLAAQPAQTDTDAPRFSLGSVKAALSGIRISEGPSTSTGTRAPWGPDLYQRTVDAVVVVYAPEAPGSERVVFAGGGVLVSPACDILTAWHVTEPHEYVGIAFRPAPPKIFEDMVNKDLFGARVLHVDQSRDLAHLQVPPTRCPAGVRYLALEEPRRIEVGQDVFAIGHPRGLAWSYTEGVVSAIRTSTWSAVGKRFRARVIQTQTPIAGGSSGGPLLNTQGKLVGIVSNSALEGAGARGTQIAIPVAGLNFAIAAHEIEAFLKARR